MILYFEKLVDFKLEIGRLVVRFGPDIENRIEYLILPDAEFAKVLETLKYEDLNDKPGFNALRVFGETMYHKVVPYSSVQ